MGRHGMRWEELRWDELRWSASVKCGVWGVKKAMWSLRKLFALHRCRAQVMFLCSWPQHCNSFARSTHARAWLDHGACKVLSSTSSTGKRFMEACVTYEKRWDEKTWAGIRWEELRWDEVWSVKCEECSEKCGAWRVQCEEWSVKCGLWSLKCEVRSVQS